VPNTDHPQNATTESTSSVAPKSLFKRKRGIRIMGLSFGTDGLVKGFFGGNAYLAILFLLFICLFLWKSAIGFVPHYKTELTEARLSGVELSNIIAGETKGHQGIYNILSTGFVHEKRQHFGQQEAVIYVYEELEALVDDSLEDDVDEYLDLDDGPEKSAAAVILKAKIDAACRAIPAAKLLAPVKLRIESLENISEDILAQSIGYAQQYALDDYTTPAAIAAINTEIDTQMGDYGKALQHCKSSADDLNAIHNEIEENALATFGLLKKNREAGESVKTLTKGLAMVQASGNSPEEVSSRKEQIAKALATVVAVDTDARIQPIYTLLKQHDATVGTMKEGLRAGIAMIPVQSITTQEAKDSVVLANQLLTEFDTIISENRDALTAWRHDKTLSTFDSLKAFFFGTVWNTGSSRQSLFGIVPLFTGSLLISAVAMFFAIPLAIGAAIYVNQFANKREAGLLKPTIEFIQAIPSVVLGLFGVLVVAGLLKDLSQITWLQWIPGFPIADRLNVLLAGILLAFMASPTIFTLAEDALNNVPKSHTEASLAMGANKLQTTLKVIVPASLSGIIAAVMLGFGRVVGETMVVLLVAGNMAQMPEFTAGFDVIGQSVHTMTGIIASENGEAAPGSILWEGLFMVGLVLFMISLTINSLCQRILNRNKA